MKITINYKPSSNEKYYFILGDKRGTKFNTNFANCKIMVKQHHILLSWYRFIYVFKYYSKCLFTLGMPKNVFDVPTSRKIRELELINIRGDVTIKINPEGKVEQVINADYATNFLGDVVDKKIVRRKKYYEKFGYFIFLLSILLFFILFGFVLYYFLTNAN